jgi:DNA-binding transcriptional regulator YiaG
MGRIDVQDLVEQTGLRKQEVAAALGASVASLRRWEREGAMPEASVWSCRD